MKTRSNFLDVNRMNGATGRVNITFRAESDRTEAVSSSTHFIS